MEKTRSVRELPRSLGYGVTGPLENQLSRPQPIRIGCCAAVSYCLPPGRKTLRSELE